MSEAIANSEDSLQRAIGALREEWRRHKWLRISWKSGKKRSLDQNAISHAWYGQIARELREETELGVKCFCKLHFGVPILRAADAEFRALYDKAIKWLPYEEKEAAMKYLPVTSLMTKAQLSEYLEAMQAHYLGRGVVLEFPEE